MKPVEFEGHNTVFAKDQPEYLPLPALALKENGEVITCWEFTDEEVVEIVRTKRIYWSQYTFGNPLQPQLPQVFKPRGVK